MNYTPSENMRPEPFKAQFVPRTEEIRHIIEAEAEQAAQRLSVYDGETKHIPALG